MMAVSSPSTHVKTTRPFLLPSDSFMDALHVHGYSTSFVMDTTNVQLCQFHADLLVILDSSFFLKLRVSSSISLPWR